MGDELHPLVLVNYNDAASGRSDQLELARIKSHAARISHKRRRPTVSPYEPTLYERRCGGPLKHYDIKYFEYHRTRYGWERGSLTQRDPFASSPGHNTPTICHDALDRALDNGWSPIFVPIWPEEELSLKTSWKQAAVNFPFLFHAQAVAGVDWAILARSDKDTAVVRSLIQIQVEQRQLALRHLRNEIERPDFQPSDALIHAVALLATAGPYRESQEPYPLSPLGILQNIYLFGKIDYVLPHITAMFHMVGLKGGLTNIKEYALADILEVVDLSVSTRIDKAPYFQLVRPRGRSVEEPSSEGIYSSQIWEQNYGRGFALLKENSYEMYRLMLRMIWLTQAADVFYHNPGLKKLRHDLILGRNEIQHQLLSLRTDQHDKGEFLADMGGTTALTELIRLAASIYSDMTLFPLPWVAGVKLGLAKRIHKIWNIGQLYQLSSPLAYTELHIWILWFGCFGAFRSHYQEWFELELRIALEAFYGLRWESVRFDNVKQLLRGFLWWDLICDLPGQDLWFRMRSQARMES